MQNEQSAFLLHSRPYKEHQLLLDLLTEHDGKISALVYTGNSVKTNKRAILQPFSPLRISYSGKAALKKLTFIESAGKSYLFQRYYLYSGFYLNELMVRLLGDEIACPELFQHYRMSLNALNEQEHIETVLRHFEFSLLEELGQSFDFSVLFDYEYAEQPNQYFYYLPEQGFIETLNNGQRACYHKSVLLAFAQQDFSQPEVLQAAKQLMRQVISVLLGNKPLHSRKLFTQR